MVDCDCKRARSSNKMRIWSGHESHQKKKHSYGRTEHPNIQWISEIHFHFYRFWNDRSSEATKMMYDFLSN